MRKSLVLRGKVREGYAACTLVNVVCACDWRRQVAVGVGTKTYTAAALGHTAPAAAGDDPAAGSGTVLGVSPHVTEQRRAQMKNHYTRRQARTHEAE